MDSASTNLPVPTYSAVDNDDLPKRVEATPNVGLPILKSPDHRATNHRPLTAKTDWEGYYKSHRLELDIVASYFSAIEGGHNDVVATLISRGWVSPNTKNRHGETPLNTAVRVGRLPMVSRLVALGAIVNEFGRARHDDDVNDFAKPGDFSERTPLMVAAERGHLALVKVLIEDYGAKHDLIAPDGAIALRLAAANGHREIVQFLPQIRAGAWKRWKNVHRKQMERVRRAGIKSLKVLWVLLWNVPKLLVYEAPKEACHAVWRSRHRVKKFVKELPRKIQRAGKAVCKGIREIPSLSKRLFLAIWRVLKRVPGAIMTVLKWIGGGLKDIGKAILDIIAKAFSLLHTAVMAASTFLRKITLRDIWDGFCYLARAIFVDAPNAIGAFIASFGKTSYDVLEAVFGALGSCIWMIGVGILWLLRYIPRKIWTIIEALGTSVVKAFEEVLVFLNPKRM
ncbi:ankyrin-3 [Fusarium heterosporum]|uniref:Ankyrin-3 n=1 Tax=Fusarium heterosporum TaxID=42747 RepID=A0A8H5WND3_FUSHE|nr:ankyrin-3 [Fusarium heterosporum]